MKRYRVISFEFDTRAIILSMKIGKQWKPDVKELNRKNKEITKNQVLVEYGLAQGEQKIKNFIDFGSVYPSVIAFHNKFFRQIRNAFIIGSYYPSLTATCSLGERVLNHLILKMRDFFKHTVEYKKVYKKSSFENWQEAIDTLVSWEVLLPSAATDYQDLAEIRHKAIHFNPDTDRNDRALALKAIKVMSRIIKNQFSAFGNQPWFIPDTPGANYIKKDNESNPFIKTVYLPNCALVGPYHKVEVKEGRLVIIDDHKYEKKDITDEEFVRLIKNYRIMLSRGKKKTIKYDLKKNLK